MNYKSMGGMIVHNTFNYKSTGCAIVNNYNWAGGGCGQLWWVTNMKHVKQGNQWNRLICRKQGALNDQSNRLNSETGY